MASLWNYVFKLSGYSDEIVNPFMLGALEVVSGNGGQLGPEVLAKAWPSHCPLAHGQIRNSYYM